MQRDRRSAISLPSGCPPAVEAENPIKDYMTAVLTGGDPAKEAAKASADITRAMNAGS